MKPGTGARLERGEPHRTRSPAWILVLGLPRAGRGRYGALAALMLVALITNHRKNGFFINNKAEG